MSPGRHSTPNYPSGNSLALAAPSRPAFDATPYLDRVFDPRDWTCWHLALEFYRRELGIVLPSYGADRYASLTAVQRVWGFRTARRDDRWLEVDPADEQFGDLVTFRDPNLPPPLRHLDMHVGVVIARRTMLHVPFGEPSETTRHDALGWRLRRNGFFRHRSRA